MTDTTTADVAVTTEPADPIEPAHPYDILCATLCAMDTKAKVQGHSLEEVLWVAAKNAFGIDIRVDPNAEAPVA